MADLTRTIEAIVYEHEWLAALQTLLDSTTAHEIVVRWSSRRGVLNAIASLPRIDGREIVFLLQPRVLGGQSDGVLKFDLPAEADSQYQKTMAGTDWCVSIGYAEGETRDSDGAAWLVETNTASTFQIATTEALLGGLENMPRVQ